MEDINKQYKYDSPSFKYETINKDQSSKKAKVLVFQESIEVRNEQIYQQLMNDMYGKIENGECFDIAFIEKHLIRNMLPKYNRTQAAKLLGICVRTLRNKINEYGFQDIRINKTHLL